MRIFLFLALTPSLLGADPGVTDLQSVAESAAIYRSGDSTQPFRQLDEALAVHGGSSRERADLEMALIRLLQPESTIEAKLFACQRLAIIGTEKSLPALAALLRSEDTVGMACIALANCPRSKADTVLREALPFLDGQALVQVVATLGHRRNAKAVPALIELISHPHPQVAEAAVIALGRIADRNARRTLSDLRRSLPPNLREVIDEATLLEAEALTGDHNPKAARALYEALLQPVHSDHIRAGALAAMLALNTDRAQHRILGILEREDPSLQPDTPLRPVALAAVGNLRSAQAGLTFAGLLGRLPTREQVLLIQALADLGPNCPRTALATHLSSSSAEVRLAVIRAFAQLNSPDDVNVFAQAAALSRTPPERHALEAALVHLPGGVRTDLAILATLANPPAKDQVAILSALARRGSRAAIPALFAAAQNAELEVARTAFQGLGRIGGAAELPAMIDLYASLPAGTVRSDAEAALARILNRMPDTTGRAQAVCAKLAAVATPERRVALLRLLPLAGGEPALAAARAAALDPDPAIRDGSIRALAEWPTPDTADDLIALYRESTVPAHQALALRGLARMARDANTSPTDDLLSRYRTMLEVARTNEDRRVILGALGGCSHPDALALALEQYKIEAVRAEADQAIRRIADAIKGAHPDKTEAALKQITG